jgi:hypothetical protein
MRRTNVVRLAIVTSGFLVLCATVSAEVINFEQFVGPALFSGSQQTLNIVTSIGNVTVSGGMILTQEANLPANQTSVYATALFDNIVVGFSNPITVTFPQPITNFFLNVYNGNTDNIDYTIADNAGNSATMSLIDNFSGGQSLMGFAAGGTVVTITAGPSTTGTAWDFAIDNVTFNEPLPPDLVPEPGSARTLGGGLTLITALVAWKRATRLRATRSGI